MTNALARLSTRRPRALLLVALIFVIIAAVLGGGVTDRLRAGQGTEDPNSESAHAAELLDEYFPNARPNFVLMVSSDRDVDDRAIAQQGVQLAERLAYEESVSGVTSYWHTGADSLKSPDGRYALIVAHLTGNEAEAGEAQRRLAPDYQGRQGDLEVQIGGVTAILSEVEDTIEEDLIRSEVIALPLTLLILVLVFRGVIAALLPLAVGIIAIIGTNAALWAIAGVTDVSVFAQNLTTALGLGLAIDYALLMVRRFRDELELGADPRTAVTTMLNTAGRTVFFSALTVSVALAAMLLFPLYFLRSFAYAGVSVVLLAAAAALLVLPALLVVLGKRVNSLDLSRLLTRRRAKAAGGTAKPSGFVRLTSTVMRRAPIFAVGSVALLVLLGLPFLRVEFGMADDRQLPAEAEPRVVQQIIRDNFDSSATGVIDVLARGVDTAEEREDLVEFATAVSALEGVQEVQSPVGTFAEGRQSEPRTPVDAARETDGLSYLQVHPEDGIEDISPESQDLVRAIRDVDTPLDTMVAGQAAALVDSQQAIGSRLGWALGAIVLTTLVLVFLLTGSVLVPIQAVVLNALSLTAMFGAVVWIFQDGNLAGLIGFTPSGFIDTSLPVLMFCMAFGLSMDYGVFLLSRMKEEYDRTGDNRTAVSVGLQRTAGIITAAAIILAVVLFAIGFSRITNTMMLGWGVALAVLVDATVVRTLLVPAVMRMTGRATWWAPAPLRRLHDRFGLRESAEPVPHERASTTPSYEYAGRGGHPADPAPGAEAPAAEAVTVPAGAEDSTTTNEIATKKRVPHEAQ
ncbi:MMPL family transporter [Allostreptomyces psammosilenae]|uniref:RND superfamily putative drug exporter n=1 Tax=Allostreptomyces psammosilenae TaxID=1892865 RepID=A0A852ZR61_9ACTN|nr:MMPL family transporter [Allostreptomyces psammosilenae]NYI03344.1 RND superfamily putative drug exporter [Allostreptomyces psammosilenae]